MKKFISLALLLGAILLSSCGSQHDFTACEGHVKNCPISEDCPHQPICEAHEKCAKDKVCTEHPACEAFD